MLVDLVKLLEVKQAVFPKIWTRFADFISYGDNRYDKNFWKSFHVKLDLFFP